MFGFWGVIDVRGMGYVLVKVCIKKGEINSIIIDVS